jgi:hypothetical protein
MDANIIIYHMNNNMNSPELMGFFVKSFFYKQWIEYKYYQIRLKTRSKPNLRHIFVLYEYIYIYRTFIIFEFNIIYTYVNIDMLCVYIYMYYLFILFYNK